MAILERKLPLDISTSNVLAGVLLRLQIARPGTVATQSTLEGELEILRNTRQGLKSLRVERKQPYEWFTMPASSAW